MKRFNFFTFNLFREKYEKMSEKKSRENIFPTLFNLNLSLQNYYDDASADKGGLSVS